ncbi:MAG: hypothetical protein ACK559_38615, partial [bacterium]
MPSASSSIRQSSSRCRLSRTSHGAPVKCIVCALSRPMKCVFAAGTTAAGSTSRSIARGGSARGGGQGIARPSMA